MFRLFKYLKAIDWVFIALVFACIFGQVWLELMMPDYMAKITTLVQSPDSSMDEIWHNGLIMCLCAVGSLLSAVGVCFLISTIAADYSKNTRKKLFDKVEELDYHQAKQFSTSSLITRTTNDITQTQMVLAMGMQMIIRAPMTVIVAISKIMHKNWQWSSATAIGVVILLSTIIALMLVVIPKFKRLQKLTDRLNGITRENITGVRVVHAFNAEKYQEDKFDSANAELSNAHLFTQRAMSILSPMMYLIMEGVSLAIYYIGAVLIDQAGGASERVVLFGDMITFSSYAMQIIISFLVLAGVFVIVPRAQVSAKRINEVLKTKPTIQNGTIKGDNLSEEGTVEFRNVSFKYPGAQDYMLKDISFKANKGDTVAIIGSTGSGKSTLVNLIPRLYDSSEGTIFVDGVDVKEYKQSALRNKIGYVPQKAVMFDGSILANVSYGDNGKKKTNDSYLKKALEIAQAKDFIEKMPKGYKSHIAQGGTNVSGGQRQRLAIARAIARKPEIFIFDDSFSALDFKTDAKLRKALKENVSDATSIIVVQRIGTIMHADQILVLDDGKCVGKGTHKDLLKKCEVYKQIALSQLTKEELNV